MNTTTQIAPSWNLATPRLRRFRPHWASSALLAGLLALAGQANAQSVYHRYLMQGQILSVTGKSMVVCIGKRDGAAVGDELSVIRHVAAPGASKAQSPFRREVIGKARVVDVFDEHYATLRVVDGTAGEHDMVELERK